MTRRADVNVSPGTLCRVNGLRDAAFDADARAFIGQPCVIVKRTKAGLIEVALAADPTQRYAFPAINIERCDPDA